jgi:lipopolysaccharide export system protein LptA
VAYFKSSKEKKEEGKEKLALDRVEAEGNVFASGPKGVVTGDRGVYFANTQLVEVFGNVKVTQEGNIIKGEYGRHNLKTDVAEIFPHAPGASPIGPSKRISGIIYPKDAKKMKEKESEEEKNSDDEHEGGHIFPTSATNNHNSSP